MSALVPRILGFGYEVPANTRGNDDPIFDWLRKNNSRGSSLFTGYKERRVLAEDENLETILTPAAIKALRAAKASATDIDLLVGYGSVAAFETPNELARLHQQLALPERAWVLPVNNEFSNFNAGVVLASAMIAGGQARNALVAVGGDWTRHVDYHTPQAVSASDGAGACVMGLSDDVRCWRVVDVETITQSQYFGTMFMAGAPVRPREPLDGQSVLYTRPYFQITEAGLAAFTEFGEKVAPQAALRLMARNRLTGDDIALVSHQASTVLLDSWQQAIRPGQYVQTIAQFGNMTLANIPVNLGWSVEHDPIRKDSLVLLGIGCDQHANAVLLQRGK